ncbi:MAG: HAD hydrolase family protein [Treponema sp.]|jgi:3-deoxy-D-manno-octulosonate 8-phosphate phosphatase (KDO 8-P phosphatase)|nr:HAD hydrolase family protein [Treponema sp.]
MNIKLVVLNVGGTLTDDDIVYGGGLEAESFSVKDGLILKALPRIGIPVLLFTGRESKAARGRAAELGCEIIENTADKESVLERILDGRGLTFADAAYIGDDLNDFVAMKRCGFKACPSDAAAGVKALADYISPYPGGHGAVHDVCEKVLQAAGLHDMYEQLPQAADMHESFLRLFQAL